MEDDSTSTVHAFPVGRHLKNRSRLQPDQLPGSPTQYHNIGIHVVTITHVKHRASKSTDKDEQGVPAKICEEGSHLRRTATRPTLADLLLLGTNLPRYRLKIRLSQCSPSDRVHNNIARDKDQHDRDIRPRDAGPVSATRLETGSTPRPPLVGGRTREQITSKIH